MQKYIIQDWIHKYDLIGIYFIHLFLFVIFIILFHIFHPYIFSLLFIFSSISIYFIIRYKIIIYVFSFHFMQSIQNFNKENSVPNSFLHEELSGIVPPITNYQQDLHFVSGAYRFSWIRSRKLSRMTHTSLRSKQYNIYSGQERRGFLMLSENLWPLTWMLETINGIELRRNSCNFSLSIRPSRFYHLPSHRVLSFSDLFSFSFIVRLFMEIDALSL